GLELYDIVTESLGLQHFGCLQHCRTYYHKALKVTELPSGRALAKVAMEDYLGKVFKTERDIKELREERERTGATLELDEIRKLRRQKSAPVLATFKRWVEDLLPGVPPQSALGKALAYTTKHYADQRTMPNGLSALSGRCLIQRTRRAIHRKPLGIVRGITTCSKTAAIGHRPGSAPA